MIRKILIAISSGLVGSLMGAAVYSTKIYMPNIWKNKAMVPLHTYLFFGFVAGCGLAYFWLKDREK